MFSPDIVSSDDFLDMPISSQVLYFHLAMRADDDGFVTPKMVMRLVGSSADDLKVLISKRFILPFETGVVVIKHWLIHNLIRADLYKETLYKKEKSTLGLNENGAYTEIREGVSEIRQIEAPEWLKVRRKDVRTANVPQTVHRIGKDRLELDKVREEKTYGEFQNVLLTVEEYNKLCEALTPQVTDNLIAELSSYLAASGKKYKSYYAALQNWARRRIQEHKTQSIKKGKGIII